MALETTARGSVAATTERAGVREEMRCPICREVIHVEANYEPHVKGCYRGYRA